MKKEYAWCPWRLGVFKLLNNFAPVIPATHNRKDVAVISPAVLGFPHHE